LSEVEIVSANPSQSEACLPIMLDSVLGHYFEKELARTILERAQAKEALMVALKGSEVVGFYVNPERGSFLVFPYLHLLAVKTSERSQGIGVRLLEHLEQTTLDAPGCPERPKTFLLVSDPES